MPLYSSSRPNALTFAIQHTRHFTVIGTLIAASLVLRLNYETAKGGYEQSLSLRFEGGPSSEPGRIAAVINTAKMGTGGLSQNFINSWGCKEGIRDPLYLTYNCPNEGIVVRAHQIEGGVQAFKKHRQEHPEGKCLIVTAIRSPKPWLPSLYVQNKGVCENISMTKEEMLQDYKHWLSDVNNIVTAFDDCIPRLLQEFNGGSLVEQAKVMDHNNGYSILESTSSDSVFAGCELLFLRMEQHDRWSEIIETMIPGNKFYEGKSRATQCPELADHISMLQEYELTNDEKMTIYTNGGPSVVDWFDTYGYIQME